MPVPAERDGAHRQLMRDAAHDALCTAIVDGTLAPGERLHDAELCSWLGLSRTPVRAALARLEEDGLIEMEPQRFTRVTPLEARDAHDTFIVLASVHGLATNLGVPRMTPALLERAQRAQAAFIVALQARDAAAVYDADDRLHAVFVTAADNHEIARILEHAAPRLRRLELLHDGPLPGRRAVAQHEALLLRASVGDRTGAASAARENWLTLGATIERSLLAGEQSAAAHD